MGRPNRLPQQVFARVDRRGRITLPVSVREFLSARPSDRVAFSFDAKGNLSISVLTGDLLALQGSVRPRRRGISIARMNADVRRRGGRP